VTLRYLQIASRAPHDAPGANQPPPFPAEDLVVTLALPYAFLSGTSRLQFSICSHGLGPRMAGAAGERP